MLKAIVNFLKGIVLGLANIIPGVSGGTMAVSMNCYDEYVETLGLRKLRKNLFFLISAGIGMLLAIWFFSKVASEFILNYALASALTFVGLILGSMPLIFRHTKSAAKRFGLGHFLAFAAGIGVMIGMAFLNGDETTNKVVTDMTPTVFLWLICMMTLSAFAMLIPGVSGSLLMTALGAYGTITGAISRLDWIFIAAIVIGAATGLLLGSRLISFLLRRFGGVTYAVIMGLVLGSVIPIVKPLTFTLNAELFIGIGCMLAGGAIAYFLSRSE